MTEVELVVLFVPFVEGEINNPAVGDFVGVFELKVIGKGDAELT